ncbi:MAG: alkaline phosphatase family protein [Tidjanibacter sp.]|nr:alkaline phosphatase family protein [Tidjanibacter sp.]
MKNIAPKTLLLSLLATLITLPTFAAEKPRLVVNIVISQMRPDYLDRFGKNLTSKAGFGKFFSGVRFTNSYYDFMQTTTPATLATLTTGTDPSVHGVVGDQWVDFTTGNVVRLIDDKAANSFGSELDEYQYSNINLIVPTLGDRLLESSPKSMVVSVAADPQSAIVMGGLAGEAYWFDSTRGNWTTSTRYQPYAPSWLDKYNQVGLARQLVSKEWLLDREETSYVNTESNVLQYGMFRPKSSSSAAYDYGKMRYTPAGNTLVTDFAKQLLIYKELGRDKYTDLLYVCFDATRLASEKYGPESMEVEDMFYKLDREIADLVQFVDAQFGGVGVLFVLTSDHGASDSFDKSAISNRQFNVQQFKVLMGSFLSATYGGEEDWVKGYANRQLYINRQQVYDLRLSLEEVQRRAASFALQFGGTSHILTSEDMQSGYYGSGYGRMIQNGFYPRRSGDLTINLMPGWIESYGDENIRATSGSLYDYDTHVPLMMYGCGLPSMEIDEYVNMNSVAATIARIIDIDRPIASTAQPIEEAVELF